MMSDNWYEFLPLEWQADPKELCDDIGWFANNYDQASLNENEYSKKILETYFERRESPHDTLGLYQFDRCQVSHGWGFVELGSELPCALPGLGWGIENIEKFPKVFEKARKKSGRNSIIYEPQDISGLSAIISFPGIYTFGHWIVDVPFRFFILHQLCRESIDHYLIGGPPQAWMLELLDLYSVNLDKVIWLDRELHYDVEKLYAPTILSHARNGVLPIKFIRSIFNLVKNSKQIKTSRNAIVFVLYKPLTSIENRTWTNQAEVARFLESQGVLLFDPLRATINETIDVFSSAKLIIGQDGSGLHNCVFSDADCVVIETLKRGNMIHASIQDANSRKITYLLCDSDHDGNFYLSKSGLKTLIDIIDRAKKCL